MHGRNAISWEKKFDLDVQYADNIKFVKDWRIVFLTVKKVFVREGINAENVATMEVFQGTRKEGMN